MEEQHVNKRRKTEEINNNTRSTKKIKMYCPASSKTAEIMACEDRRLDIGTIARMFGLEPATLRFNGHFITRGVDLIASSVTWRSLLSFFSSRGLCTGTNSSAALVVDGKLVKCGTKRAHYPTSEVERRVNCIKLDEEGIGIDQTSHHEEINSPNYKKLKESNNVCENDNQEAKCNDTGLKRKNWLENISPLIKRVRVDRSYSHVFSQGHKERDYGTTKVGCGYPTHDSMKRTREDDVIVTASCKRTR
ncbi:hypothetical protein BVRB_7g167850 isoform B [Beta vulgaris subsp. vulgaris]|nr:hypothetical protein BVRB_7g167850 isoform B [Beta vulgaris subsp. vulgaris]